MSLLRFVDPSEGTITVDGVSGHTSYLASDADSILLSSTSPKSLWRTFAGGSPFCPKPRCSSREQSATTSTPSRSTRYELCPIVCHPLVLIFPLFLQDEECLDALRRVHLLSPSSPASCFATPASYQDPSSSLHQSTTLSTFVASGGDNFSQGQKQLISLARA
jgi:hypothetical protein